MNGTRWSPAEETAAVLGQAERSGFPVLIPGAFEKRAAGAAARLRSGPDVVVADHAQPVVASELERLVYEREGGGAPSARRRPRSGTFGERLWHSMLHPTRLRAIWRRALPQAV